MPTDPTNEPQRIRKHAQKVRILNQLKDQHCLLSVRLTDHGDNRYSSAILDVDSRKERLRLDELTPEDGHRRLRPGSEIRIDTRAHGVETRFLTTVEHIDEENGIAYYVVPFPDIITYHQRRAFHRVPVRMTLQSSIALQGDGDAVPVRLTDLSVGGFGGTVKRNYALRSGERYECSIELRGEQPLKMQVEVRYAKWDSARKQLRFGALFLDPDPRQRSRLERLVMELERALIRST